MTELHWGSFDYGASDFYTGLPLTYNITLTLNCIAPLRLYSRSGQSSHKKIIVIFLKKKMESTGNLEISGKGCR